MLERKRSEYVLHYHQLLQGIRTRGELRVRQFGSVVPQGVSGIVHLHRRAVISGRHTYLTLPLKVTGIM